MQARHGRSRAASLTDEVAVAVEAALAAGAVIRAAHADRAALQVANKGPINLVTQVDLAAEDAVRVVLARRTPDVPVHAEEGGGAAAATTRWVVDPLDGTTNFVHGFPAYAVAVALQREGEIVAGCVYDAANDHLYTAARGAGAWCGDERLAVSRTPDLAHALVLTGFPYDRTEWASWYLRFVQSMLERTRGMRRAGAAALDFAHIAAGRADGFWEFGLQPWDVAAGMLLVEEAGGRVTDLLAGPLDLERPRVLATNGLIHKEMAETFHPLVSLMGSPPGARLLE